ncbi:MAG: LemA family protein [Pseudomonadota bacterium]|nr:LemA family protein [Pseudomonadota bacterium]
MDLTTIIAIALILVAALYAVLIYNNLVRLKHNVAKTWSNIDVSLKQRHEELPKLVEVCKQYMQYEQETLERVVRARGAVFDARGRGDLKDLGAAETELRASLGRLFALAENYPDLKANDSFNHLSKRVSQLEETIADRRELYNDGVNLNNVRVEQFPDVVVARLLGFQPFDLLEFSEVRSDVDVAKLFA